MEHITFKVAGAKAIQIPISEALQNFQKGVIPSPSMRLKCEPKKDQSPISADIARQKYAQPQVEPTNDESLRSVDIALTNFSDSLVPKDEFISEGTRLLQLVIQRLKKRSRFVVDREYIGGSVGKHTDIISPDFDCTLFINNEVPPFDKVIEDFEDILMMDESLEDVKSTKHSVQFTMSGGFEVDLLPAANLLQNIDKGVEGAKLAEAQSKAVLNRIRTNVDKISTYSYSSSLAEAQLEFMREMDSFTHQLARLAKFWYKTLYFEEYISGAKTIVELIAVAAAMREESSVFGKQGKSMFRAFMAFLDDVNTINSLRLAFVKLDGKWMSTKALKFDCISERKNFIIEPANPYNDLAESLDSAAFEKFKNFAAVTRTRFQDLTGTVTYFGVVPFLPFDVLFEPLPTAFTYPVPRPKRYSIDIMDDCKLLNPDMKIWNEGLLKTQEMQEILRKIQLYLSSTVNSVVRSKPIVTLPDVTKRVQKMVDKNIDAGRPIQSEWFEIPKVIESELPINYDVAFTYPFSVGLPGAQNNSAVILYAKW